MGGVEKDEGARGWLLDWLLDWLLGGGGEADRKECEGQARGDVFAEWGQGIVWLIVMGCGVGGSCRKTKPKIEHRTR